MSHKTISPIRELVNHPVKMKMESGSLKNGVNVNIKLEPDDSGMVLQKPLLFTKENDPAAVMIVKEELEQIKEEIMDIEEHKPGSNTVFINSKNDKIDSKSMIKNTTCGEEYFCAFCDYKTNCKTDFYVHFKRLHIHQFVVTVDCVRCLFETKLKSHLIDHSSYCKHSEHCKLYKCSECQYQTKWKSSLVGHFNSNHTEHKKVFKCVQCTYETKIKYDFQNHLMTHYKILCNLKKYDTRKKTNRNKNILIYDHKQKEEMKCASVAYIFKKL